MDNETTSKELMIENVITAAIKIPGVKVNRKSFLCEAFEGEDVNIDEILENGPISAGVSREKLKVISNKLIFKRTSASSVASFIAGIPGGIAMAATLPADILQFFGMSLRLAQELSYLYGTSDLWTDGEVDSENIRNQLLMYCGVMFGASGAVSGVRVLTTQLAKTAIKKIPQKALTKTFWYPILKRIGSLLSVQITKKTFASGVSKAIPVVGGVISGTINFASMMPMATRLQSTFDKANFDYSDNEFEEDINIIENTTAEDNAKSESQTHNWITSLKNSSDSVKGWISKKKCEEQQNEEFSNDEILDTIKKMKELLDLNAITETEFNEKKAELLSKL